MEGSTDSLKKIARHNNKLKQHYLLQKMLNAKDCHLDLAGVVTQLYDDMMQFAQLFSSEFLESPRIFLYTFAARKPNKALAEESGSLYDGRGRIVHLRSENASGWEENEALHDYGAASKSTEKGISRTIGLVSYKVTGSTISLFPHYEEIRRCLFKHNEGGMRNFTSPRTMALHRSHVNDSLVTNYLKIIAVFAEEIKILYCRFATVFHQVLNTKKEIIHNLFPPSWIWRKLCLSRRRARHRS